MLEGECKMTLDVWLANKTNGYQRFFANLFIEWLPVMVPTIGIIACGVVAFVELRRKVCT